MNERPSLFAIVLLSFALLSGCATQLSTQVTSFHRLSPGPKPLAGQTFKVVPTLEQEQSLEYSAYIDSVIAALQAQGLIQAAGAPADLMVAFGYGSSPNPSYVGPRSSAGVSVGSGIGLGGGISVGLGVPLRVLAGNADKPLYRRELRLTIDQASAAAPQSAPSVRVFEATAVNDGSSPSLSAVFSAMVQALFADFPGEDGRTRVVQTPARSDN